MVLRIVLIKILCIYYLLRRQIYFQRRMLPVTLSIFAPFILLFRLH